MNYTTGDTLSETQQLICRKIEALTQYGVDLVLKLKMMLKCVKVKIRIEKLNICLSRDRIYSDKHHIHGTFRIPLYFLGHYIH